MNSGKVLWLLPIDSSFSFSNMNGFPASGVAAIHINIIIVKKTFVWRQAMSNGVTMYIRDNSFGDRLIVE